MSFGGSLAQALAQGLRGKRLGEERQYERGQDILASQDRNAERRAEAEWRAAQLALQQAQDARQATRDKRDADRDAMLGPLEEALLRAQVEGTGRYQPNAPPDRRAINPATGQPFASESDYLRWKAREAAAGRAPTTPMVPNSNPSAINQENTRRRALVTTGDRMVRELPKSLVTGQPADQNKAAEIAAVRDSVAGELGAPAPDQRVDPFARFRTSAPGGVLQARPIEATPPGALDPEEVAGAKALVQGRTPEEATRLLTEAGFTAREIAAILGRDE